MSDKIDNRNPYRHAPPDALRDACYRLATTVRRSGSDADVGKAIEDLATVVIDAVRAPVPTTLDRVTLNGVERVKAVLQELGPCSLALLQTRTGLERQALLASLHAMGGTVENVPAEGRRFGKHIDVWRLTTTDTTSPYSRVERVRAVLQRGSQGPWSLHNIAMMAGITHREAASAISELGNTVEFIDSRPPTWRLREIETGRTAQQKPPTQQIPVNGRSPTVDAVLELIGLQPKSDDALKTALDLTNTVNILLRPDVQIEKARRVKADGQYAILYQDGPSFIVQGVDFDLAAQGSTPEDALRHFRDTVVRDTVTADRAWRAHDRAPGPPKAPAVFQLVWRMAKEEETATAPVVDTRLNDILLSARARFERGEFEGGRGGDLLVPADLVKTVKQSLRVAGYASLDWLDLHVRADRRSET